MKWVLHSALLCAGVSEASALTLDTGKVLQFEVNTKQTVTLHVKKQGYYRGYIRSNTLLEKVVVNNSKGDIVKTLLTYPAKEAEVFWPVNQADKYQIQFRTKKGHVTQVELLLRELQLKQDQYLSPETDIISPLIKKAAEHLLNGHNDAEKQFWQQVSRLGAPLVEYTEHNSALVTFLYRGQANNVKVLGSPGGGHSYLSQLGNSSIWYRSFEVPADTRFSYRIAPNVPQLADGKSREQRRAVLATAQPDPLNNRNVYGKGDNLFGAASTLTLTGASSDVITKPAGSPQGTVNHHIYTDSSGLNARKVSIYHPNEAYLIKDDAPVLILFDGDAYLEKIPTPLILDNLIAQAKIPAMRAVFINPPLPSMRAKELTPNQEYADFMANELMPWLCKVHTICPDAANTTLSGSSYGGLASMFIAFQHPEKFGKVISQSGSFWWTPAPNAKPTPATSWMTQQFLSESAKEIEIYLTAGLFETEPKPHSILQTNRQLFTALKSHGYAISLQEASSGHDYFSWQVMLADGLITLFSHKKETPNKVQL